MNIKRGNGIVSQLDMYHSYRRARYHKTMQSLVNDISGCMKIVGFIIKIMIRKLQEFRCVRIASCDL